jgi:hypothetical protein
MSFIRLFGGVFNDVLQTAFIRNAVGLPLRKLNHYLHLAWSLVSNSQFLASSAVTCKSLKISSALVCISECETDKYVSSYKSVKTCGYLASRDLGLYFSAYPGTNERRTGLLPVISRAAKNVDSSVELGSEISGSFMF